MRYLLLLFLPLLSFAQTLHLLEKKLEETKTIRVSFVQKVSYSWYPKPDISKGFFYAQRGGKFRIEYEQPERMLIVSDGRNILIYYPQEKSAIIDRVENNRSAVIEALFLLSKPLSEVFESIGEIKNGRNTTLVLKPKLRDEEFHRVYVELDEENNIKSIKIEDKEGTTTTVEFLSVSNNFSPSEDLFKIKLPQGVKVKKL
ncbi:LolA family protein [Hydrogenobacter hydrogenophilus]|uniref:Outer membrane lipoprotein carrier protein n=1 Tax=Hydrogenobacter hydrogenophilus TaxID=35835 RepID=A0A285NXY9_9AQUI|nr:outer membrane lipoprotein carrier protein LolA [Hydrogenobacter hydrogenophilus]SNZ13897.1 outer membrane lipoprotein carrier protein [Hydrogenobacter hydrogenophilus]